MGEGWTEYRISGLGFDPSISYCNKSAYHGRDAQVQATFGLSAPRRVTKDGLQLQEFFESSFSPFPPVARLFIPSEASTEV